MIRQVRYFFGAYSGIITVVQSADDDDDALIAKAKKRLRTQTTLSMAAERYELLPPGEHESEES